MWRYEITRRELSILSINDFSITPGSCRRETHRLKACATGSGCIDDNLGATCIKVICLNIDSHCIGVDKNAIFQIMDIHTKRCNLRHRIVAKSLGSYCLISGLDKDISTCDDGSIGFEAQLVRNGINPRIALDGILDTSKDIRLVKILP